MKSIGVLSVLSVICLSFAGCAKEAGRKATGPASSPELSCRKLTPSEVRILQMARGEEEGERGERRPTDPDRLRTSAQSVSPNFRDENCETPLTAATRAGRLELVSALLQSGAKPNLPGPSGRTALHFAASRTDVPLLSLLVENGANPNQGDVRAETPLHRVGIECETPCAAEATVIRLREVGALLNARDEYFSTPLHHFAKRRSVEAFAALLSQGADPKVLDQEKRTLLHTVVFGLRAGEGEAAARIITLLSEKLDPAAVEVGSRAAGDFLHVQWLDAYNSRDLALQSALEAAIVAYGQAFYAVRTACEANRRVLEDARDSREASRQGDASLAAGLARSVWVAGCGYLLR